MSEEKLIIDGLELIEKINNWRNKDFENTENPKDWAICDVLDSVIEMIYDMDTIETQGWVLVKDLYRLTKNGVCASNGCGKSICTDCSTLCMVFDQLSIFENAAEQGRLAFLPQPYKESE